MKRILVIFAFFFASCVGENPPYPKQNYKSASPATMRPYTVMGKTYYPIRVAIGDIQNGIASWYGPGFHGKLTSNGERFNTNSMTAAHKTWPMNTIVEVKNLENGKKVIVRINDRGPFVDGRIIDLSNLAAHKLDMTKKGTARVRLRVVGVDNKLSTLQTTSLNQAPKWQKITNENYLLQIAAFKSLENAKALAKKIPNSEIKLINNIYKVYLKGFKSYEEAMRIREQLRLFDALIMKE